MGLLPNPPDPASRLSGSENPPRGGAAPGWVPRSRYGHRCGTPIFGGVLRDYAHPHIGDKGIDRVTTADVMAVLLPIWTRKHPTAKKVRRRIGVIMKWAIAQGYRADNPAGEEIAAALPKSPLQVEHTRALPRGEVAGAVAAVRDSSAWIGTRLAFEFLVLTAARSGEVRGARWHEIDLEMEVWSIPAARMKAGREHRVPLSGRSIGVLHEAAVLRGGPSEVEPDDLVFPSRRGKVIQVGKMSQLVHRLGIRAVPHGFRSSFRDWGSECTDHPRAVIEAALAHAVRNETEAAYARSDLFERRRRLMHDWMQYLNRQPA